MKTGYTAGFQPVPRGTHRNVRVSDGRTQQWVAKDKDRKLKIEWNSFVKERS